MFWDFANAPSEQLQFFLKRRNQDEEKEMVKKNREYEFGGIVGFGKREQNVIR